MENLYSFEDNTLILPYHEANNLNKKNKVSILFKFDKLTINNMLNIGSSVKNDPVEFKSTVGTEVSFPCLYSKKEKLFNKAEIGKKNDREYVLNGAQFWNYLGDGTHCSEIVSSPFGLTIGQKIKAENKYNISKINCVVADINIIRSSESKSDWFWYLLIEKIS